MKKGVISILAIFLVLLTSAQDCPYPTLIIGGTTISDGGNIKIPVLRGSSQLQVSVSPECPDDIKFTINSFTLELEIDGRKKVLETNGGKFSKKIKKWLVKCDKGAKIVIKNVSIVDQTGKAYDISQMSIEVN